MNVVTSIELNLSSNPWLYVFFALGEILKNNIVKVSGLETYQHKVWKVSQPHMYDDSCRAAMMGGRPKEVGTLFCCFTSP